MIIIYHLKLEQVLGNGSDAVVTFDVIITDIIVDDGGKLLPIEIKSGKTINAEFFKNIKYWSNLSKSNKSMLLYAGEQSQKRTSGNEILNWRNLINYEL